MGLIAILARCLGPTQTWPVTVTHKGTEYPAIASKVNEHGQWFVTFQEEGKPYPTTKWITPTDTQMGARHDQEQ